jgi:hypothetical protein
MTAALTPLSADCAAAVEPPPHNERTTVSLLKGFATILQMTRAPLDLERAALHRSATKALP